jgi:hypothetical protein
VACRLKYANDLRLTSHFWHFNSRIGVGCSVSLASNFVFLNNNLLCKRITRKIAEQKGWRIDTKMRSSVMPWEELYSLREYAQTLSLICIFRLFFPNNCRKITMHLLKLFSQPFQKYIIKFIISTEWRRSNGFLGTNSSAIGIGARQIEILHQLIECNQDEQ